MFVAAALVVVAVVFVVDMMPVVAAAVVVVVVVVVVVEPYESGLGYTAPGPKVMLDGECTAVAVVVVGIVAVGIAAETAAGGTAAVVAEVAAAAGAAVAGVAWSHPQTDERTLHPTHPEQERRCTELGEARAMAQTQVILSWGTIPTRSTFQEESMAPSKSSKVLDCLPSLP